MKHEVLISRSKTMSRRRLLQQVFGLMLAALFLTGCGGAPAELTATPVPPTATPTTVPLTPTPTRGIITGMVLDDAGKPLANIYDQETLIVALVCSSDDSDIECFHRGSWETNMSVLFDFICEADDAASNCQVHLGQGATSVEADGSYTIADVPSGKYGLVFLYRNPGLIKASYNTKPVQVQAGEIIKYDIATGVYRE